MKQVLLAGRGLAHAQRGERSGKILVAPNGAV